MANPFAVTVVLAVTEVDTAWTAALAAGRAAAGMDTPTTMLKPVTTMLVGPLALGAALMLPRLCVPGALLMAAGATSNMLSLERWRAVPNPLAVHLAGGILHLNMADLCVTGGGALFLAASLWTLWRMPDERFARPLRSRTRTAAPRVLAAHVRASTLGPRPYVWRRWVRALCARVLALVLAVSGFGLRRQRRCGADASRATTA